ncbi:MAG: hypothetical protein GY869_06445 [Planctomycetes bacterium]|nr:hypothetical protein [Planctomycetota bacterium]
MVKNDSNDDDQLIELLNEYLEGTLSTTEAQEVEKRLVEDPLVRQLFVDLKQVNKMVRELPRVSAPEDLTEQIRMQLERDVLFGIDQQRGDSAGRFQLHLRRWLSVAAMFVLTGAVALIIYSVLIGPISTPPGPGDNPPFAGNTPQQGTEPIIPDPGPDDPIIADPPWPQLALAHLEIRSDNQAAKQEKLAGLLTALNIQNQQQSSTDTGYAEFALKCRSDQLTNIFQTFQNDPNQHIDLILVDENTGDHSTVEDIGVTPMITLVVQSEPLIKTEIIQAIVDGSFTTDNYDIEILSEVVQQAIIDAQPPINFTLLRNEDTETTETKDPNAIEETAVVIDPNSVAIEIAEPNEIVIEPVEPEPMLFDIKFSLKADRQEIQPEQEIK